MNKRQKSHAILLATSYGGESFIKAKKKIVYEMRPGPPPAPELTSSTVS